MNQSCLKLLVLIFLTTPAVQAATTLATRDLARWDFEDDDLLADTLVGGLGAEITTGSNGFSSEPPMLSFANSPAVDGGRSLQVFSAGSGNGAAFSVTNNSSETAFIESATFDFIGQNASSLSLYFTDEPLPPASGWADADDGIVPDPTSTTTYFFDLRFFGSSARGKELDPGETFSVMLASNVSSSTLFIDTVNFRGTAVPEPSQLLFLLTAGALLRLKRRR